MNRASIMPSGETWLTSDITKGKLSLDAFWPLLKDRSDTFNCRPCFTDLPLSRLLSPRISHSHTLRYSLKSTYSSCPIGVVFRLPGDCYFRISSFLQAQRGALEINFSVKLSLGDFDL